MRSDPTDRTETLPDLTLAGLIHDLNNVFQTLVGAADQLAADPRWSPVGGAILRSIERGREITASLQTVGQPAAPLERILQNAIAFVEDTAALRRDGPEIRFDRQIEPGIVLANSWAWERVFLNLFSNAVRVMPKGGTIYICGRRRGRQVELIVADEGPGITAEIMDRLFEPRVSTRASGGLGLHIVRAIVEQEDGQVRAANRPAGGAEFTIVVPDAAATLHRSDAVQA